MIMTASGRTYRSRPKHWSVVGNEQPTRVDPSKKKKRKNIYKKKKPKKVMVIALYKVPLSTKSISFG